MGVSFVALFVLLLFGGMIIAGIVLIVMSRGKGLGYPSCGACGYDLSGTIGAERRCPECGADFAIAGILPPTGKRRPGMLASGIVLLVISLTCFSFAVVLPVIGATRVNTAQQQAVQQQQAAMALAAQATEAALLGDELAELNATLSELQQRQAEIADADAASASADVSQELARIEEEIDATLAKIAEVNDALENVMSETDAVIQVAPPADETDVVADD